jgi:beta-glucosidase
LRAADAANTQEIAAAKAPVVEGPEIWKDATQPIAARVKDLVRRMTLEEKVSQMRCDAAAIPRLGVPAYSHRNECLHGVVGSNVTVFPQAIGMAATWDTALVQQEADTIATEARARHNDYIAKHHGNSGHRFGVSYYTPNINIFRDPRWGRGQETYGEDPFLTAQTAVAFIHGLQGDDPKYVKIMACAKHFAVHSGPEPERHRFDARPSEQDLYDTYLPAFEAAVREGHAGSVMGAYSSLYGIPACASRFLLTDLLRGQWGFDGFVVSDGGAISDIWAEHKYVPTREEAAVAAVKAGCDFCSGNSGATRAQVNRATDWTPDARGWLTGGEDYEVLTNAVHNGLISEKELDPSVSRELTARFRLGIFDPPSMVPWSNLTLAQTDTPEHRALALKVAQESIVLLKNNGLLPLNRAKLKRIAVIGPNADARNMLDANYGGTPSRAVTILAGIEAVAGPGIEVTSQKGCPLASRTDNSNLPTPEVFAQTVAAAKAADVVIYVGGLDATLELEQANDAKAPYPGFYRGDRTTIELPSVQLDLLKALQATGKPVVFVNCSGSAIAMPWEAEHLAAILQAWYPGEEGGRAVAEVLFGQFNPAGRLPVTFYRATADLPAFDDYSMSNRTYRYFGGKPLFAFGHGLSYTKFQYSDARADAKTGGADETVKLAFTLRNSGKLDGDEVAQVYVRRVNSATPLPKPALCGFARIHLASGQATKVTLDIPAKRLRHWDANKHQYVVEPGNYELLIGGASDDIRLRLPLKLRAAS